MKKTPKNKFIYLVTILFIIHFLIAFSYLLSGLLDVKPVHKATGKYINPFFEQNWSMFSEPGSFNRFVLVQYNLINKKTGKSYQTEWLDISKPLLTYNERYYFSISQRLLKYMSGCVNNILQVANQSIASLNRKVELKQNDSLASNFVFNSLRTQSSGYVSLKKYALAALRNLHIPGKHNYDSATFAIKILDDSFPTYADREKNFFNRINHTYTEFNIQHGTLTKQL